MENFFDVEHNDNAEEKMGHLVVDDEYRPLTSNDGKHASRTEDSNLLQDVHYDEHTPSVVAENQFLPEDFRTRELPVYPADMGNTLNTALASSPSPIDSSPKRFSLQAKNKMENKADMTIALGIQTLASESASKRRPWTKKEDELLKRSVDLHNGSNWKAIARLVPGRTHIQCLQRWRKSLNPAVTKGRWTPEEDALLIKAVAEIPNIRNWGHAARYVPGRTAKQCRERYTNHLDPRIVKGNWTPEEDHFIMESYSRLGTKWAEIAHYMPGRSENSVKVRAKCIQRKQRKVKQQRQGKAMTTPKQSSNPAARRKFTSSVAKSASHLNTEYIMISKPDKTSPTCVSNFPSPELSPPSSPSPLPYDNNWTLPE